MKASEWLIRIVIDRMVVMWFFRIFLILIVVCMYTKAGRRNDDILLTLGITPGIIHESSLEKNPAMLSKQGYKTPRQKRLDGSMHTLYSHHQSDSPKILGNNRLGEISKFSYGDTLKSSTLLKTDVPVLLKESGFDNFSASEILIKEGSGV